MMRHAVAAAAFAAGMLALSAADAQVNTIQVINYTDFDLQIDITPPNLDWYCFTYPVLPKQSSRMFEQTSTMSPCGALWVRVRVQSAGARAVACNKGVWWGQGEIVTVTAKDSGSTGWWLTCE